MAMVSVMLGLVSLAAAVGCVAAQPLVHKDTCLADASLTFAPPYLSIVGQVVGILSTLSQDEETDLTAVTDLSQGFANLRFVVVYAFAESDAVRVWALPSTIGLAPDIGLVFLDGAATSTLPTQLGSLSALFFLRIANSPQFEGTIPSQLAKASSLLSFNFENVPTLAGTIPTQLGLLPMLTDVRITHTGVGGTIPPSLVGTHKVELLLNDNNLTGTLPEQLATARLSFVAVHNNQLTGTIPPAFLVPYFSAHNNLLEGSLTPQLFAPNCSIVSLSVSGNRLTGPLPSQVGNARALEFLFVHDNQIDSSIPSQLGSLPIHFLDLHNNRFSGEIPSQIAKLVGLSALTLHDNELVGPVPSELGAMALLTSLRLDDNRLSGELPSQLGSLTLLEVLQAQNNRLVGSVPWELGRLTSLKHLDLRNNALQGSLHPSLAALGALTFASVADNRLHGQPPSALWLEECDNSGLDDRACEYDCPVCGDHEVKVRDCDWKGRFRWCVHVGGLVGLGVAVAVVVCVTFRVVNPTLTRGGLLVRTGLALCFLLELYLDFLFAVNTTGVVSVLAFTSIALHRAVSAIACGSVLRRTTASRTALGMGLALAALDASAIKGLVPAPRHGEFRVVTVGVVLISLSETLLEGSLQAYTVLTGDTRTVVVLALVVTACSSFCVLTVLAVVTIVSRHKKRITVFVTPQAHSTKGEGEEKEGDEKEKEVPTSVAPARPRRLRALLAAVLPFGVASLWLHNPDTANASAAFHMFPAAHVTSSAPPTNSVTTLFPLSELATRQARNSNHALTKQDALGCDTNEGISATLPVPCLNGCPIFIISTSGTLTASQLSQLFPSASSVTIMFLSQYLRQSMPASIHLLQSLALLIVFQAGPLPTEMGLLSSLEFIALRQCEHLRLPSELGGLPSLGTIVLIECPLTQPLPSQLGRLPNLRSLRLQASVGLGSLPSEFGLLSNLGGLECTASGLDGALPSQLGLLSGLETLALGQNMFVGTLAEELHALTALAVLALGGSRLEGSLPALLESPSLRYFDVHGNALWGTLPTAFPASPLVTHLDLSDTLLSGTLPTQLGRASLLTFLSLEHTRVGGTLPTQLALLTALTTLNVGFAGLSGPLPSQLARLTNLVELAVHSNALRGPVPSQLALLSLLTSVELFNNEFDGELPATIGDTARSVWLRSCDDSGIADARCLRDCPGCALDELLLLGCDSQGYGQTCVPLVVAAVVVGVLAMATRLVLRIVSARPLANVGLVLASGVSMVAAIHWALDVLFAINAAGTYAVLARVVLVCNGIVRFLTTTNEFAKSQLAGYVDAKSRFAYSLFALGLVVCMVDPSTLRHVFYSPQAVKRKAGVEEHTKALLLVLGQDIPQLVLQSVAVGSNVRPANLCRQALAATVLSLVVAVVVFVAQFDSTRAALSRFTLSRQADKRALELPRVHEGEEQAKGQEAGEEGQQDGGEGKPLVDAQEAMAKEPQQGEQGQEE